MHEKLDDLRTTDRSWKQSEVEVPPGHARHRRQRLPVKVILQHRRLSAWRPGTAAVRALAQSAPCTENNVSTFSAKHTRCRFSDAAAGAGNENYLVLDL